MDVSAFQQVSEQGRCMNPHSNCKARKIILTWYITLPVFASLQSVAGGYFAEYCTFQASSLQGWQQRPCKQKKRENIWQGEKKNSTLKDVDCFSNTESCPILIRYIQKTLAKRNSLLSV